MKSKIVKYTIFLVIIAITITGIFTSALARYFYKYEVQNSIENTAVLLTHQIDTEISQNKLTDFDKLAKEYAKLLNEKPSAIESFSFFTRITIIDYSGKVLGESDSDANGMQNHLNRKEVKEAIQGKMGTDERFSETLKVTYLYVAFPIEAHNIIVRVSIPLYQINSINKAFFFYTIIGILAGLLLTILISVQLSKVITDPIRQLINTSKEIAGGNYKKRVNITSKDEIGQLAYTFNEMADKLDETLLGMMDKNVRVDTVINSMRDGIIAVDTDYKILIINTIACDIFGVRHGPGIMGKNLIQIARNSKVNSLLIDTIKNNTPLTDEIIMFSPATNTDKIYKVYTNPIKNTDTVRSVNSGGVITLHDVTSVKKLEQIRTEFVSNVTHELKTPLTSIRGFVETLKNGAIEDTAVAAKFLDIIDIEAERLYMLINDILQLSEIEGMRKDDNIMETNLNTIIGEVVLILEAAAQKKGVRLIVEVDQTINLLVNKNRIKQMLINLVDNAIKYNVENGAVYIRAGRSSGKTYISIKDTGIGISEKHHSRIFERFYRVDKGRSRNMGGTGLGLSIVKHIVNLYSGDIRVVSQQGQGTEFLIQLPL
ncbi:sensor protein kinase WalK [Ruminiclostridium hungatei]|uniref:histidine kinase n=1 Tax=Ruminiclostridium hungatei TaxID=48256 RepID=A0A1V4SKG4_RUMHU|nr:ATP-binding protein [Ruminiclostridium hungatei]OPX44273.1 sensor protein kinase WalK [Ruminiclostridium hungatei]